MKIYGNLSGKNMKIAFGYEGLNKNASAMNMSLEDVIKSKQINPKGNQGPNVNNRWAKQPPKTQGNQQKQQQWNQQRQQQGNQQRQQQGNQQKQQQWNQQKQQQWNQQKQQNWNQRKQQGNNQNFQRQQVG